MTLFQVPYDLEPAPDLGLLFWGEEEWSKKPHADSGRGSSYYTAFLQCARRWYFRYVENLTPDHDELRHPDRAVGSLVHFAKELYRANGRTKEAALEAQRRLSGVAAQYEAFREIAAEATRCFLGWVAYYERRDAIDWDVLAVERHVEVLRGDELYYTCRYDAVMRHRRSGAIWIWEDKHLSSAGPSDLQGYLLDWQVAGEAWLYMQQGWGPIAGVVVDISVRTAELRFHRPEVAFSPGHARSFAEELDAWHYLRDHAAYRGYPMNRTQCKIPFPGAKGGLCDFYDLCLNHIGPAEIAGQSPPHGFVRVERLVRR